MAAVNVCRHNAHSPSGKAQHFDCCNRWFESNSGSSEPHIRGADLEPIGVRYLQDYKSRIVRKQDEK